MCFFYLNFSRAIFITGITIGSRIPEAIKSISHIRARPDPIVAVATTDLLSSSFHGIAISLDYLPG
jgi:hypothetical protein